MPEHRPVRSNAGLRNPYAPCVIGSHLCAGCGVELRGVSAPPDPVYALPVCVCPGCGLACVRRKHRLRTHPVAFRKLDRVFNRLAFSGFVVALASGTSLLIAVFMSLQSDRTGRGPFGATFSAIRSAPPEELFSVGLAVGSIGMTVSISGILLSRLLWHWRALHLILAWAGLLFAVSLAPTLFEISYGNGNSVAHDVTVRWASRLQALAMCWCATGLGVAIDRATRRPGGSGRKFGRSLRWARKQQARRRAG